MNERINVTLYGTGDEADAAYVALLRKNVHVVRAPLGTIPHREKVALLVLWGKHFTPPHQLAVGEDNVMAVISTLPPKPIRHENGGQEKPRRPRQASVKRYHGRSKKK